ncbi:hypothetical protein HZS61_008437 [Fusarium oxysporum f. sp. conglutinans]|uniref:Reverse transcriptase domain-containing protein n=2 Tax=Fusarium oxysporum f. sp. conglutinans TaxID=100902 RepID=A0A8H6H2Z9_FUSOX|nr:hypothetical protein FOXB_01021 [Fusarium oxysporum f. sp. conglutinans Fo5176]KAF6528135.1 hypothetical protein HZS61_008437 [Fusarium oxysporum f. sp. conglutinans]KAG7000507.1 RNA-directed DNA polymerase from mobile element jockey [Fusarium oxysporum f. sp. conglutinans]
MDHDSDHLPIVTSLDLNTVKLPVRPRRNWKALDEKMFFRALQRELPPQQRPRTKTALDRRVGEMMAAITAAIEEAVPKTTSSPWSRPGWNEECTEALAESKLLRRQHSLYHTEDTWEAYRMARNYKGKVIKKAFKQIHREKVEEAAQSPASLWRIAKWARNRLNQTPNVTPALVDPATQQQANAPSEKAVLFRRTFFPLPPETDLSDIECASYPIPTTMPPITTKEIEEAIEEAAPLKAPGPDGITNRALQIASPWIKNHLTKIFNQSLALGYYPEHFRRSTMVILRKPGKDNYTIPKAYRPIALLNTTGKIMEAIIAKRLSYIAKTHGPLPDTQMGGRKLRSTEHALHLIIDKIYDGWNTGSGKVASLLLLDVLGVFDNVSYARLLHSLRKRKIDEKTVKWIRSFLSERYTKLSIDGFTSEPYKLETGEPQGSNLSPILYLFYNADLIEKCGQIDDSVTTGFIDEWGFASKLGYSVMDNAGNNDTMMRSLSLGLLRRYDIQYDPKVHRLRCQGQIINLAAKTFLFVTDNEKLERDDSDLHNVTLKHIEAWRKKGPLGRLHNFVVYIQRSVQRSQKFLAISHNRRLARDNDTRWSSWHTMLRAALNLKDAIDGYFNKWMDADCAGDELSLEDWIILEKIKSFLEKLKMTTKALESSFATLGNVLLVMDFALAQFEGGKEAAIDDPVMAPMYNSGWAKLDKYYRLTEESPAYVAAIVLHPSHKWHYIQENWKKEWAES